jgi:gliding motility-associated protein GldE
MARVLMFFSNIIERRVEKKGYRVSLDDLNEALEMTTGEETTDEEKEILKGIVNFGTIQVKQIMRSRIDVTAFDVKMDFHQLMDRINKSNFSRIPVYKETIDHVKGILYVKDLLPFIEQGEEFKWQKLIREPYFVPETKKIDDLLKNFQEKHVHMAIAVDEYGGTAGLITLEDIIEEIVGEINDEFDSEEVDFTQIDSSTYIFEGKTSLNDLTKIIDMRADVFDEVKGESESVGGLLLELNSSMPKAGDEIVYDRFAFKIESVNSKRIKRVRLKMHDEILEQ